MIVINKVEWIRDVKTEEDAYSYFYNHGKGKKAKLIFDVFKINYLPMTELSSELFANLADRAILSFSTLTQQDINKIMTPNDPSITIKQTSRKVKNGNEGIWVDVGGGE